MSGCHCWQTITQISNERGCDKPQRHENDSGAGAGHPPLSKTAAVKSAEKRRRLWPKKLWQWLLLGLCLILLIVLAVLAWAWTNRDSLLENLFKNALLDEGIEAELSIDEITRDYAILKNVRLKYEGERFFSADRIRADYVWREALEGQFNRLEFERGFARITLDKDGQIIDGWVPPGMGQGGESGSFPKDGIVLTKSELMLETPYGELDVAGDVNIASPQNLSANLSMAPTTLTYGEGTFDISGRTEFTRKDGVIDAVGELTIPAIAHPAIDADAVIIAFDGRPDIEAPRSFTGTLGLKFKEMVSAQVILRDSEIDYDGTVLLAGDLPDLDGRWAADIGALILPDPARVEELADNLSLAGALSETPIAREFIPSVKRSLIEILSQSQLKASGSLQRNERGARFTLDGPVTALSGTRQLTLTPKPDLPIYAYDRASQMIAAHMDVALDQPARLSAKDLVFQAGSINGWRIDGVSQFKADIRTGRDWVNAATPARLRPLAARVNYNGADAARRRVDITGNLDYDGPIPGGIVDGMRLGGTMGVTLTNSATRVDFTPTSEQVTIERLETPTEWTAFDLTATLAPAAPIYRRAGDTTKIFASLSDIKFYTERQTIPARLDIQAETSALEGTLTPHRNGLTQDWEVDFTAAKIASEDLPGPNTRIDLGSGNLESQLISGQSPTFALTAPQAQIQTELLRAKDMQLSVSGTPDNYTVEHAKGLVKLTGNDLPPMPMTGTVTFENGQYNGEAVAYLPQANDAPFNIDYVIKDGRGTASVDIEALQFRPGGLQPQTLVPTLRGKVAQVDGIVSAKIDIGFGAGEPLTSSGTARLENLNFGTAPGPLKGVSTEIVMDSVLPLKTRGRQTMTVDNFDPGLPLENGVIEYELVEDGVRVYSARWPLGEGFFSLDPFTWLYAAEENRMTLRLEKVGLGAFLDNLGEGALQATGDLEGTFPIVISGVNVRVDGGRLEVKDGGRIRYAAKEAEAAGQSNEYAGMAMKALRDFSYDELFAEIDGPLDGDILVGLKFEGNNAEVLNGQPFAFDVKVEGELFNILRSFDTNAQVKALATERQKTSE